VSQAGWLISGTLSTDERWPSSSLGQSKLAHQQRAVNAVDTVDTRVSRAVRSVHSVLASVCAYWRPYLKPTAAPPPRVAAQNRITGEMQAALMRLINSPIVWLAANLAASPTVPCGRCERENRSRDAARSSNHGRVGPVDRPSTRPPRRSAARAARRRCEPVSRICAGNNDDARWRHACVLQGCAWAARTGAQASRWCTTLSGSQPLLSSSALPPLALPASPHA